MSSVFLSHTHSDKPFARRLASDLRKSGHIVWIDEAEIEVGDSLIERIRDGIDRVDFLAVLLSRKSVESEWVKKELDIASNRELDEKRVVVLPLLLEEVPLPGFVKGKLYADFRDKTQYDGSLALLLRKLGPSAPAPPIDADERKRLRKELADLKKTVEFHTRDSARRTRLAELHRTPELEQAIRDANANNPEWSAINEAHAFQVGEIPITLQYACHAIHKASVKGSHPIEMALALENKWGDLRLMLEAFKDYRGLNESSTDQQEAES